MRRGMLFLAARGRGEVGMKKLLAWCKRFHGAYVNFIERQGFLVVLGVCVAVIVGTAVWSRGQDTPVPEPTPPVDAEVAQAAQLQQERLQQASATTAAPTPSPSSYLPPLAEVRVLQGFDAARLHSGASGLWQLHDACDLAGSPGEKVTAMAAGTVVEVAEDSALLCEVTVDHGGGVVAQYAGMAALAGVQAGDPVSQGQTLGFIGNGPLWEQELEPHLHLRVTRNGNAVDPTLLWQ